MSNLGISLIITVIGMGLVFIAILLLWALMEIIVKITAKETAGQEPEGEGATPVPAGFKQRVAAAAVAVAMAMRRTGGLASSPQAGSEGYASSAWLAAGRLASLNRPSVAKRNQG